MNTCLSLSGSTEQQSGGFSPRLQRVLDDCSATATDPEQVEGVRFAIELLMKESCVFLQLSLRWGSDTLACQLRRCLMCCVLCAELLDSLQSLT